MRRAINQAVQTGGTIQTRLHGHPFLRGISNELRQDILAHAQVVNEFPSFGQPFAGAPPQSGDSSSDGQDRLMTPETAAVVHTRTQRVLVKQGQTLPPERDGLLLTALEDNTDLDIFFNGTVICKATGPFVVGHEVAFGISQQALFEVHVRRETKSGMIFIPREPLMAILALPKYAADLQLLRERAEESATDLLRQWLRRSPAKARVRLFANSGPQFLAALMNAVAVRICKAGTFILREGEPVQSCICIFHGEAVASIGGATVTEISSSTSQPAWRCWWGVLEVTKMVLQRPAAVLATTDCVVLDLSADGLVDLRGSHLSPCSLLDKVAVKHLFLLEPFSPNPMAVPMLQGCRLGFLEALEQASQRRIMMPGEVVIQEREEGDDMFILVRGSCSVHRGEGQGPLSTLTEGACFGELAMLGISRTRTATVQCETVCELRVLGRAALLEAVSQFPEAAVNIEKMAEARGNNRKVALRELRQADIFGGFSDSFIQALLDNMHEQPFLVGQTMIREGQEGYFLYVMVSGEVDILKCGIKVLSISAPTVLGELALLQPGLRSRATVRCRTFCDCLVVRGDLVSAQFLRRFPDDMGQIEAMLGTRTSDLTGLFPLRADQAGSKDEGSSQAAVEAEQNAFFRGSDPAFLERLSDRLTKWIYLDGQTIVEEGTEGRVALIIQEGTCSVDAGCQHIGMLGVGDVIGEAVVLSSSPLYVETVRARGQVVAFAIDVKNMSEVISHFPAEKLRLQESMKKRMGSKFQHERPNKLVRETTQERPTTGASSRPRSACAEEVPKPPSYLSPRQPHSGRSWRRSQASARSTTGSFRPTLNSIARGPEGEDSEDPAGVEGEVEIEARLTKRSFKTPRLDAFNWERTERWINNRREQMRSSGPLRQERMVRAGRLVIPVPSDQGWRVTCAGAGTAFHVSPPSPRSTLEDATPGAGAPAASPMASTSPSALRLRKAARVYGRPVWKEVFGQPAEIE